VSDDTQPDVQGLEVAADLAPIDRSTRWVIDAFGGGVHFATAATNTLHALHPAERTLAEEMAPGRRASFVAGRVAMSRALRAAGHPPFAVTASCEGVPILPEGYLGSITHKHGRAVGVVARQGIAAGLGIDLEFDDGLDDADLRATVLTAREADEVAALATAEPNLVSIVTLVLAAKEAVYKAVFPLLRSPFDFDDVELTFEPKSRAFRVVHLPGDGEIHVEGRYSLSERWIVTLALANRRRP